MKNANISRLGGFTLIELLVVVLIIGILAAMALPQYFKAVERTRMVEAVTLMDSVAKAQRRKLMQTNRYAATFEGLDVSPKGATGMNYHTKGEGNGFNIQLMVGAGVPEVVAWREFNNNFMHQSLQYQYNLRRYFQSDNVSCTGINRAGEELCADFCGIDTPGDCCNDGTSHSCPAPTNN